MKVGQLCLRVSAGIAVLLFSVHGVSQSVLASGANGAGLTTGAAPMAAELPDAPVPQEASPVAADEYQNAGAVAGLNAGFDPGVMPSFDISMYSSSADGAQTADKPAAGQSAQQKSEHDLAEEQLKKQKQQRTLGLVPAFNISYVYNAAPLTAKQKFALAFRSEIDPAAFGVAMFVAGIEQAEGAHSGYGGGWGGYAKRFGQSYTDSFDGQMLGNALLPSLLHQDPRYFRLGRGTVKRRILYALGTNVIAHHDGTGRWEPNYSNVLGNLAAGGIANLYLPQQDRGFSSTITGAVVVIAEGGAGSLFQEFWPDIARRFLHKDPTNGQDAINATLPDPSGGHHLFYNPPKHPKPDEQ